MSLTRPEVVKLLANGKRVRAAWDGSTQPIGGELLYDISSQGVWHSLLNFNLYKWTEVTPPKMVPLEQDDIDLHRDLFRFRDSTAKYITVGVRDGCILIDTVWRTLRELQIGWQRSIDGGTTWQACQKEEQ